MGMYTGLRFKGIVKEEYRRDIKNVVARKYKWNDCDAAILREFGCIERSSMIPFGALSYMPDCWEKRKGKEGDFIFQDTDGFHLSFDIKNGLWTFQCSLKNYAATIDIFIRKVVPQICDKVFHCEMLYEECEVSDLYYLEDGEMVRYEGIRYEDYNFNIL